MDILKCPKLKTENTFEKFLLLKNSPILSNKIETIYGNKL